MMLKGSEKFAYEKQSELEEQIKDLRKKLKASEAKNHEQIESETQKLKDDEMKHLKIWLDHKEKIREQRNIYKEIVSQKNDLNGCIQKCNQEIKKRTENKKCLVCGKPRKKCSCNVLDNKPKPNGNNPNGMS